MGAELLLFPLSKPLMIPFSPSPAPLSVPTLYPHLSMTSRMWGGREESFQERMGFGILPPLVVML